MVASAGASCVIESIALVTSDNGWVDQVLHGALGSNVHTALRIRSPAIESSVEVVVRVSVGSVLHTVVSFSVEPVLSLDEAGEGTSHLLAPVDVS